MTVAPDVGAPGLRASREAVSALREHGLRLSTARRLVLEALFAAEGPRLRRAARPRAWNSSLTSVYRNLETLERHGLVRHVHLGHGPGLYALVGDGEQEYLYCERCHRARAARPPASSIRYGARSRSAVGYQARFTHFALVGTCGCRNWL